MIHHTGRNPNAVKGTPCQVCGDREPFHVHKDRKRTEDYFVVGRGQDAFAAAVAWKKRALAAEQVLREHDIDL